MGKYRLIEQNIEIAPETGRVGVLRTIEHLLRLPRVQEFGLSIRQGIPTIAFKRMALEDEPDEPFAVELASLTPFSVLRRVSMDELDLQSTNASAVIGQLFHAVSGEGLWPIAFVIGTSSGLNNWYLRSTKLEIRRDAESLHGAPLIRDPNVDDEILVLLAGYSRTSEVVDAVRAFKIHIPEVLDTGATPYVEVMP